MTMLKRLFGLSFLAAATSAGLASAGAPAGAPGPSLMSQMLFFLPLLLIFYFLLIRPQQKRAKKHAEMIGGVKRGDTVVTSGGLIGKVHKVADAEITVDLADGVRVKMIKTMIIEVRGKGQPVAAND
jgi:preprotein translocase subunit YajC